MYADFTLYDLFAKFGVEHTYTYLDLGQLLVQPSESLLAELSESREMPIRTEKARSEWIAVPILKALRKNNPNAFTIYSGEVLNADRRKGLYGECDIYIDKRKYYLNEIAELLGRFQYIINSY